MKVYDLTVEDDEEFVVNGILVHNSKVHHCGSFPELEAQLTEWVPFDADSPDRLDALVYAVSYVAKGMVPARVASPLQLVQ